MRTRALEIFEELTSTECGNPHWRQLTLEDLEYHLAEAILAERTRCANIARNWPDRIEGRGIAERIMDDAR